MWFFMICMTLMMVKTISDPKPNSCSSVEIISREGWKARPAVREKWMPTPVSKVIILHTVTFACTNAMNCTRNVQFIQDMHLDDRGWWDIAYNFLIGGDARVYEGRGWKHTGAHSVNFNTDSLGIAFIGNYNEQKPTETMLKAALNLIACGVQMGYLTPSREIHGHRDVSCTESPGKYLYEIIRQWDNYKGGRMPKFHCNKLPRPVVNKDIIND